MRSHLIRAGVVTILAFVLYQSLSASILSEQFGSRATSEYLRILRKSAGEQDWHICIVILSISVSVFSLYSAKLEWHKRVVCTAIASGILAALLFHAYQPLYPTSFGADFYPSIWIGFLPVTVATFCAGLLTHWVYNYLLNRLE